MKPEFQHTPDYLRMVQGGARARLTRLRDHAAQSPSHRLVDWHAARKWGFDSWEQAYGTLAQGYDSTGPGRVPVWHTHAGPEFRDERDSYDIGRDFAQGWCTDTDCSDTASGIVARLPHGRFIAGYRWTSNNERVYFPQVFDDESDAARMADEHARVFAERAREDSERFEQIQSLGFRIDEQIRGLRRLIRLRNDAVLRAQGEPIRAEIEAVCNRIRTLRDELAEVTRLYEGGAA
jgi:hypothetical protein